MNQDLEGGIRGADDPWDGAEHTLGHCWKQGKTVTDEMCLDCFEHTRTPYERFEVGNRRMVCVEQCITGAATYIPPVNPITADDLNGLSQPRVRAILANVVMVAQHDTGATARTVLQEVRLHMAQSVEALPI